MKFNNYYRRIVFGQFNNQLYGLSNLVKDNNDIFYSIKSIEWDIEMII